MANPQQRPHLGSLSRESHESGLPGFCPRLPNQPSREAREIEGSRRESMLQVNVGLSSVTRLAQAKGSDTLRKRAFNAGPRVILFFEFLSRLPLTGSLKRLIAGLWAHRE